MRLRWAVVLAAFPGAAPSAGPAVAAAAEAPAPVRAEFIVAGDPLAPGARLALGVHLKLDRGWHVYWLNPGDSGLPTRVQFSAPAGFSAGPLQWPLPQSFTQPGGIQGFGYEDEVLLWSFVTAPAKLDAADALLVAEASWLACKERCIPGRARLERRIRAGDRPASQQQELLRVWSARAPDASGDLAVSVAVRRQTSGRFELQLKFAGPAPKAIEFFPGPDPALEVRDPVVTPLAEGGRIAFDLHVLAGQKPASQDFPCLIAWTNPDGRRRGAWIVVPINQGG